MTVFIIVISVVPYCNIIYLKIFHCSESISCNRYSRIKDVKCFPLVFETAGVTIAAVPKTPRRNHCIITLVLLSMICTKNNLNDIHK